MQRSSGKALGAAPKAENAAMLADNWLAESLAEYDPEPDQHPGHARHWRDVHFFELVRGVVVHRRDDSGEFQIETGFTQVVQHLSRSGISKRDRAIKN